MDNILQPMLALWCKSQRTQHLTANLKSWKALIALPVKAFPDKWLDLLLERIDPKDELDLTVHMDEGREIANRHCAQQLFAKHGYAMQPTAAEASQQNPNAE